MPIGYRALAALPTTDCQPWQCGAPDQYITPQARIDCPTWGPRGVLDCSSAYCAPSPWCRPAAPVRQAQAAMAAPAAGPAPVTGSDAPGTPAAPSQPAAVIVQTATGPQVVSSNLVPGVADQSLTPTQIHIPNIWDLLDPSAMSQFEYRGLSMSLPVWISEQYRRSLAAGLMPAAPGQSAAAAAGSGVPWWVWLAIGGAAYYLGDRKKQRRVRGGGK